MLRPRTLEIALLCLRVPRPRWPAGAASNGRQVRAAGARCRPCRVNGRRSPRGSNPYTAAPSALAPQRAQYPARRPASLRSGRWPVGAAASNVSRGFTFVARRSLPSASWDRVLLARHSLHRLRGNDRYFGWEGVGRGLRAGRERWKSPHTGRPEGRSAGCSRVSGGNPPNRVCRKRRPMTLPAMRRESPQSPFCARSVRDNHRPERPRARTT
jgi:hypothetical protein